MVSAAACGHCNFCCESISDVFCQDLRGACQRLEVLWLSMQIDPNLEFEAPSASVSKISAVKLGRSW